VATRGTASGEYWGTAFPQLANGKALTPVQGGYHPYTRTPVPIRRRRAARRSPSFLVAVAFAHEYGHAVRARLDRMNQPSIVLEQQADCFAGSWAGDVRAGHSQAFQKLEPDQLDSTVAGFLMLRDRSGTSALAPQALAPQAHSNAFDRVRAFQEGFEESATKCARYAPGRPGPERPAHRRT
jgi:hypothetical protein